MTRGSELSPEDFASDMARAPGDFFQSAIKAAYQNPSDGISQLVDHLQGKAVKLCEADTADAASFGSLRWHAQQFGGALGTMLPYYVLNKLTGGLGKASGNFLKSFTKGSQLEEGAIKFTVAAGKHNILQSATTGVLMEGVCRPVYSNEGDFNRARAINATAGLLTFTTLGVVPGALKARDEGRFLIDQPWLVNSFQSDLRRHIASGLIAGAVDAESRSLLSGQGIADPVHVVQSAYSYGILGGAMRSASEIVPAMRYGTTINDIVESTPSLRNRAKLDPIAKELLLEHGGDRVRDAERKSSQDIYDLFVHAHLPEAGWLKYNLKRMQAEESHESSDLYQLLGFDKPQLLSLSELLSCPDVPTYHPYHINHPLKIYAQALENYDAKGLNILAIGKESVAIKLEDGNVLKLFTKPFSGGESQRYYDMPIVAQGKIDARPAIKTLIEDDSSANFADVVSLRLFRNPEREIHYINQPKGYPCVSKELADRFANHMSKIGYDFYDFLPDQLAFYDGRIVLIDYFSVVSKEIAEARRARERERVSRSLLDHLFDEAAKAKAG